MNIDEIKKAVEWLKILNQTLKTESTKLRNLNYASEMLNVLLSLAEKVIEIGGLEAVAGKEVSENSTTTFIDKEKQTLTGGKPESLVVNDYTPNHCPHCGKESR
jgi:hypothetical protein